jgi:predicted ribosomally synthesized peptide with nif11-like leader
MSAIDEFTEKLTSDQAFADKIKSSMTSTEIIAAAKGAGIDLSDADIAQTLANNSSNLSDEELESVTVGTPMAAALIK